MKILNVIATLAPRDGGPYKTVPELAHALIRRGHEVDIYTTNMDGPQDLAVPLKKPVDLHGARVTYFQVGVPRSWKCSLGLASALSKNVRQYDIVHIYSLYLFHGAMASYVCRRDNVPYLIQPHGTLDPFLHKRHRLRKAIAEYSFENRNFRGADIILFNSEEERRLALPYILDRPQAVVSLGLNIDDYRELPLPGQFRSRYPQLQNKKILLYLGRINFKKGLNILIAAFSKVHAQRPDIRLVIAGLDSEGYSANVRAWCRQHQIEKAVLFVGMLSEEEKRAAMVDADLFALTSYTENFGVTILESLACGTPVLISDRVNIWREIVQGHAGDVTSCDPRAIAAKLLSLFSNSAELTQMKKDGQRLVREKFDWASIAQQQEDIYRGIVEKRKNRAALPEHQCL